MLTELSDVELVRCFRSGDPDAFDAIVRRHQDRVYRLVSVWLHDGQQAEDAAQEDLLRAWTGLRRFRFHAAPFTWLYRTARNVCREYNRRRIPAALDEDPADDAGTPDQQAGQDEIARRIRRLVSGLPERQRDVVLLRVFEGLSVAETARAMGCREGTVKASLHKALRRLRLAADEVGLEP